MRRPSQERRAHCRHCPPALASPLALQLAPATPKPLSRSECLAQYASALARSANRYTPPAAAAAWLSVHTCAGVSGGPRREPAARESRNAAAQHTAALLLSCNAASGRTFHTKPGSAAMLSARSFMPAAISSPQGPLNGNST